MVEQTTARVEPRERADSWSEQVGFHHTRLDFRYARPDSFSGEMTSQRSDTYDLITWRSDRVEYARTPRLVRQAPAPDYRFVFPLAGELTLRQNDRQIRVTPGSGRLLTLDAPFELLHDPLLRGVILSIPACEIEGPLNRKSPLATGVDLSTGLGRVLHGMLVGLHDERTRLDAAQFDAVTDRAVELLCMLAAGDDRPDVPDHLAEVEAVVRRYARDHAADPGLTGTSMARGLGWSLRQIQLALQRAGTTPRELIREERLRVVRDRLQRPEYAHMTISELACAMGFSSASALSTAFRQRFGTSPRELRRRHHHA
ncbi:helix-turn-helix domain-containing protein [Streptomyces sp. NPDC059176]|uniref:AraC-like ligand-binding domain-containing protein n=1 Tax=unclassified Streptomyces TaxID=2593676 RepID=UPI0036D0F80B